MVDNLKVKSDVDDNFGTDCLGRFNRESGLLKAGKR